MSKETAITTRATVMAALQGAIIAAPESERNKLAQALEDYARRYTRGYSQMRNSGGFLADMLGTLEEAADCRIDC